MASGFPVGIGGTGCICGALSGRIMIIGLVFGRKVAKNSAVNDAMRLSAKLHCIFIAQHKTTCYRVLTNGMTKGSVEHMQQCISFTGEMAYETAKIVAKELVIETI